MFSSQMNKLLVEFEPRDIPTLEKYLLELESTPSYKKLLSSMIKFSDMYRPKSTSVFSRSYFRHADSNIVKRIKRAQIYMNKKKIIKTYDSTEGKMLAITSTGNKIFYEAVPLAKLRKKPWDGFWTVVMYDFEEKTRRNARLILHKTLNSFGFGSPQRSIMVSPLPIHQEIKEMIETEEMENEVWVMHAQSILGMKDQKIAQASWPLKELNYFYNKLIKLFPKAKEINSTTEWIRLFLAVDNQNPYLPKELLPKGWAEAKCKELLYQTGHAGILKAIFTNLTTNTKRTTQP